MTKLTTNKKKKESALILKKYKHSEMKRYAFNLISGLPPHNIHNMQKTNVEW